jgi:hypothetical protein
MSLYIVFMPVESAAVHAFEPIFSIEGGLNAAKTCVEKLTGGGRFSEYPRAEVWDVGDTKHRVCWYDIANKKWFEGDDNADLARFMRMHEEAVERSVDDAIVREREACARLCENEASFYDRGDDPQKALLNAAKKIRRRR